MKNETDYLVSNPKQIVNHLTQLMSSKCIITAQFGEQNLSFLTLLLEIDEKNNEIKLDCAPSELLNRQLLTAVKVLFRSEYEGIKVSFRGHKIRKIVSDGLPTLAMPLPDAIFWLQRRNFYRVKIPYSHTGSFCRIMLKQENTEGEVVYEMFDFKLLDLGIRGFSIHVTDKTLLNKFICNDEPMNGILHLHERTSNPIAFIVRYHVDIKTSPTIIDQRIGCFLTEISPIFESTVQLYMQDIERQNKKFG